MKPSREMVRAVLVYAACILGLSLMQTTLPDGFTVMDARPDLTLVLAVLAGYLFGRRDGIIVGLLAGFMRDALAGRAMGLGMLLLMYAGLLASAAFRKFFRRSIPMGLVLVVMITILYHTVITLLSFIIPMLPDVTYSLAGLFQHMLRILPGAVIANALAGIPLILLLYFAGPYRRGSRQENDDDTLVGDSLWQMR